MNGTACKQCMEPGKDRRRLLNEIGKIDFVLKDLNLYLDTHAYDQQAIETFKHYNMMKNQMVMEYTRTYGPLVLGSMDPDTKEWQWSLQDWPWERGYH